MSEPVQAKYRYVLGSVVCCAYIVI